MPIPRGFKSKEEYAAYMREYREHQKAKENIKVTQFRSLWRTRQKFDDHLDEMEQKRFDILKAWQGEKDAQFAEKEQREVEHIQSTFDGTESRLRLQRDIYVEQLELEIDLLKKHLATVNDQMEKLLKLFCPTGANLGTLKRHEKLQVRQKEHE